MLDTENIKYSIGDKNILNGISARFMPGKLSIILGPNGSGKSTFLKIFSGDIHHFAGTVMYARQNIKSIPVEKLARFRAVMSQQTELSFPLTAEEVVMMGRYPHFSLNPSKKDEEICRLAMNRLSLSSFAERNYLSLSGGEKQRVQYARVLSQVWETPGNEFRYLFLDEPLNSLDINYQQEFLQVAKEFAGENTIVVAILHDINLAIQYADELFIFKEGRIAASGLPEDIIREDLIEKIFKVKPSIIENPITGKPLVIFDKVNHDLL